MQVPLRITFRHLEPSAAIEAHVGAHLSQVEAVQLARLLAKLLQPQAPRAGPADTP